MRGVKQKCVAAVSAGALLLSMILSVSAEKEPFFEEEAYKQESVHVTANAGGKPEEVEVEVTLLSGTGSTLPDRTTLTDIRNTQGRRPTLPEVTETFSGKTRAKIFITRDTGVAKSSQLTWIFAILWMA